MERKEAIAKAAIQLFAERGFHATATSEVAKRAGVAEGTIFHHFKTKEGILMFIFEGMMALYIEEAETLVQEAGSGLEAIEKWILFHFRFSEERAEELMVVIRDFPFTLMQKDSPFREVVITHFFRLMNLMRRCIERGQIDGSVRKLPPEETAFILLGMLNGLSRLTLLGPIKMPALSSRVIDFCRHGLCKQSEF